MSNHAVNTQATPLYERQTIVYNEDEKKYKKLLCCDIAEEIQELEDTKQSPIYSTQARAAKSICDEFETSHVSLVLAVAPTQAGKTGTMLGVLKEFYSESNQYSSPHPSNVWLITALSDTAWKTQTRSRMPPSICDHVIHLPDLKKEFAEQLSTMKDALIIIDEAQIGCKLGQTIHTIFEKNGILDIEQIAQRNIRLLMFSATPSGLKLESHVWGESHRRIYIEPDEKYTSSQQMLETGQVREVKNISGINKNGELVISIEQLHENVAEIVDAIISFDTPRYHLIRIQKGIQGVAAIENMISGLDKTSIDFEFRAYFQNAKKGRKNSTERSYDTSRVKKILRDINEIMCKRPAKHTIIFIKDRLRCAKTLVKKYLGVECERYVSYTNDEVAIQGIRATGYDTHKDIIVFANTTSVMRYDNLCKSKFQGCSDEWYASTLSYDKKLKKQEARPTFLRALRVGSNDPTVDQTGKLPWSKMMEK